MAAFHKPVVKQSKATLAASMVPVPERMAFLMAELNQAQATWHCYCSYCK